MNTNYQIILNNELNMVKNMINKPKLLLHACCAPCSSYVLEYLNIYFDITLYFYNPNISPESEFDFRADELERLVKEMNLNINVIREVYDNDRFEKLVKGYEEMPEGGSRCERCFRLRLEQSVKYAKENDFDYFTTTLTISPHKNAQLINKIGEEYGEKYGVRYLFSDFKKNNGYKRSCELSREYNLYRQNYCGCKYSKKEV